MKQKILLVATLASCFSWAQQLDNTNEPVIGEVQTMYVMDSNLNMMSGVTGSGVTWDYSDLAGFPGITRNIEILDPTTTAHADTFSTSTKVLKIGNAIKNYINSTATERISQGFVYNEPSFGEVIAKFEDDEEIMVTYPFLLGSSLSDTYGGFLYFDLNGNPQNEPALGSVRASIDGEGTLMLPNATTYNNVIRYKMIDTSLTTITLFGDLEIVRLQYEYYDIANNRLPVFTVSHIVIQQPGVGIPLTEQVIVLSSVMPTVNAGLDKVEPFNVRVYPNPTRNLIRLTGGFGPNATAEIYDQTGRLLFSGFANTGGIDISAFETGMYVLKVIDKGSSVTRTIVKQ